MDFFDFFNEISQISKTKYASDVTITEKYRDNSQHTEISIVSNDRLIYKFRTLAKNEYLYAAAQESVKRLKKFYLSSNRDFLVEKSSF